MSVLITYLCNLNISINKSSIFGVPFKAQFNMHGYLTTEDLTANHEANSGSTLYAETYNIEHNLFIYETNI